jgi:putative oxidoreductase
MNKICSITCIVARVLFGLVFVVFGLNFFFHFLPMPEMKPESGAFMMALVNGGVLTVVKVVEIAAGLMILSGCWLPFGLVIITPIMVNIVLFHTVQEPSGAPMAYTLLLLWAILVWCYRGHFKSLFAKKAIPTYC